MGAEGPAFFGNETVDEIGFAFHEKFSGLFRGDFFFQDFLADASAVLLFAFRHIGAKIGTLSLINFCSRAVGEGGFAEELVFAEVFGFGFTFFVAFENEFWLPRAACAMMSRSLS